MGWFGGAKGPVSAKRNYGFLKLGCRAVLSFFESDSAKDGFAAEGSAKTVQREREADEESKPRPD